MERRKLLFVLLSAEHRLQRCTQLQGIGMPELACPGAYVKWVHVSTSVNGQIHYSLQGMCSLHFRTRRKCFCWTPTASSDTQSKVCLQTCHCNMTSSQLSHLKKKREYWMSLADGEALYYVNKVYIHFWGTWMKRISRLNWTIARPWGRNAVFWGMFCIGQVGVAKHRAVASEGMFSCSLPWIMVLPPSLRFPAASTHDRA